MGINYNLMTITPHRIVEKYADERENCKDESFKEPIVINYMEDYFALGVNVVQRAKNALLDQLEQVLAEEGDEAATEDKENDKFRKVLIYADLKYTLNNSALSSSEKGVKSVDKLLSDGFTIRYPDPEKGEEYAEEINYVPFEKSSSMARQSEITFIDERYLEKMNERLLLGMDYIIEANGKNGLDIKTSLSKYFAYRGLYLTDATRAEVFDTDEDYVLDEKTVIIIDEGHMPIRGKIKYITAETEGEKNEAGEAVYNEFPVREEELDGEITPFDGEGLISPKYSDALSKSVNEPSAKSFQLRMPYAKGMLHTVDFKGFVKEFFSDEMQDENTFIVKDVFGKERNLMDAEIVLTKSMFKCYKWFSVLAEQMGSGKVKIKGAGKWEDPMEEYFKGFKKYGHGLYVALTDANLSIDNTVSLNYQFLNTIGLKSSELEKLIEGHVRQIRLLEKCAVTEDEKERDAAIRKLLRKEIKDDTDFIAEEERCTLSEDEMGEGTEIEDDSIDIISSYDVCKIAILKNPKILTDPKAQAMLASKKYGMQKAIAQGKIEVGGKCLFFSHDLLRLLIKIVQAGKGIDKNSEKIRLLKKQSLKRYKFYVAGDLGMGLNADFWYTFLRSPHLSRNEQYILMPFVPSMRRWKKAKASIFDSNYIYPKYLGHLKGIVMVSTDSYAPMTLGGADFDGDLVKVIMDSTVNRAVQRTAFEVNGRWAVNKYPIAIIPTISGGSDDNVIPKRIGADLIRRTFDSRVGLISNIAIEFGLDEYWNFPDEDWARNKCVECTILVGLEIDSVKNGSHPDLQRIGIDEYESVWYIKAKKYVEYIAEKCRQRFWPKDIAPVEGNDPRTDRTASANGDLIGGKYNSYRMKNEIWDIDMEATVADPEGNIRPNIDCLPFYFLKEVYEDRYVRPSVKLPKDPGALYSFENDEDWKKKLSREKREALRKLVGTYKKVNKEVGSFRRDMYMLDKINYHGCIFTTLSMQYDENVLRPEDDSSNVYSVIYHMLKDAEMLCENKDAADGAVKRLINLGWQFTPKDERVDVLEEILAPDGKSWESRDKDEIVRFLTNFNNQGYNLLYFVLKSVWAKYAKEEAQLEGKAAEEESYAYDEALFGRLVDAINLHLSRREENKIWRNYLIRQMKKEMKGILDGCEEDAVKYCYSLPKTLDGREFFWNVLDASEILKNLNEMN